MSAFTLTKTRFREGLWEGVLSTEGAAAPDVEVTLNDEPVAGVMVTEVAGKARETGAHWLLQVPVPPEAIGDGVQTFLITDASTNAVLQSFSLISGEALGDDIRAEVDLLRAELDMLKRAFRRHCLETS
ncbi:hypothetical protein [Sagittula stellata]|uniref:Uncharacterized protein n=1 Tax=Sagittula stellata (strain ATCC 700073 / DSM 11524 / E-37) TaxID=388399 RepID=A3K2F2_SAGS3|nr:hypothetical protein [Sagittula stellata]EBA08361.1 hypothetical protein SSE37_16153 [Sagittula stellata E-37]